MQNKYQQINWYPGHMFKSINEISKRINEVDIVFILLDSRIPYSSMNHNILKIVQTKPTIILFNKIDLADSKKTQIWIDYYLKKNFNVLKIDSLSGKNVNQIKKVATDLLKDKNDRNLKKGLLSKDIKAMIVGIPNVGKSTLINKLSGRKIAKVANTPGVTKKLEWIRIAEGFNLLDSPGILWPKLDEEKVGYNLAITGAIKDDIMPLDDILRYAISYLKKFYLKNLINRYGIEIESASEFLKIIEIIAKKHGALNQNFKIDYERVYKIILSDIRNGKIGKLTFE